MTRAIVINGAAGVGKDSFVEKAMHYLRSLGYTASNHSSVDQVKRAAVELGWDGVKDEVGRQFLSDLKDLSTRHYDGPLLYMTGLIEQFKYDFMFFHIREPLEIARFLEMHAGAVSVVVSRPGVQGFGNHADQNVANHPYDFIVNNRGSLAYLDEQARQFVVDLTGGVRVAAAPVVWAPAVGTIIRESLGRATSDGLIGELRGE